MRTAFIVGVLLGLAGVLAGARYAPWVNPTRLPSHTSVVANGGRAESFIIHLPADRISAHGGGAVGLRGATFPASAEWPEPLASASLLVEQFKVRDRDGNVIGVAARHWSQQGGETAAAWLIVIPSRGALLLKAAGEAPAAVDSAIAAAGYQAGRVWSGDVTLDVTRSEEGGQVAGGNGEFALLEGRYNETWTVSGVGESGEVKGTVELSTVTYAAG